MATEAPAAAMQAAADEAIRLLMMKLRARDSVSEAEERALRDSISEIREHPRGRTIVRAGVLLTESTLLIDGFVARYKDLAEGQRQVMEIHVPGDFLDLHSFVLKRLEHNVGALTAVRTAMVPHEALRLISERHPHLTRLLWLSTLLDAALHRERILTLGRRNAAGRVAHVICELALRLEIIGMAEKGSFALPLTQADLADATGLTPIHTNRMLGRLRAEGLMTFRNGQVTIHDQDALQALAEFGPEYLFLEKRPR